MGGISLELRLTPFSLCVFDVQVMFNTVRETSDHGNPSITDQELILIS